jgi:outer membrane murein-binding lipoprotein Lpp
MPTPLTPEQAAAKIAELEATVKKLVGRVDKLERLQQEAERSARSAAARLGRF